MLEKSTEENNRLIAEFMGYEIDPLFTMPDGSDYNNNALYHLSWDWLMPVVEKIESFIFKNDEYYNFQILGGCCVYVISSNGNELICVDNGKSKLDCVYQAVIEFIEWYNQKIQNA